MVLQSDQHWSYFKSSTGETSEGLGFARMEFLERVATILSSTEVNERSYGAFTDDVVYPERHLRCSGSFAFNARLEKDPWTCGYHLNVL